MSYPRNDPTTPSVNAGVDPDQFPTEWGTFDTISDLIRGLPPGCQAAAFDISSAYRITPVRPDQQHALCIFWKGKVYIDRAVAFGLSSSAGVFGAIADMLMAIYKRSGYGPMCKWVDDFFVVRLPSQTWTTDDFINLTAAVGVPWSLKKTKPLASRQRYIGFDWDLERKMVSIPEEKLHTTVQLAESWLPDNASFTMRQAAQLHGKLVHLSSIYPLIRPFLRHLSRFAGSFHSHRKALRVPKPVRSDIAWLLSLIRILPNELPITSPQPYDIGWWGDASTSFGIGVVVGKFWGVWAWAPGVSIGPGKQFDIGWAEAVAVELGLRMVINHELLRDCAEPVSKLLVRSDNMGVVAVVNKGRSRNANTNNTLREIFSILASHRLSLYTEYVSSSANIADALSRGDVAGFLENFPRASVRTDCSLPLYLQGLLISM